MSFFIQPSVPYHSCLDIRQTEIAIKQLKDFFQVALAKKLRLTRVTAPLFVCPETGLNDNLNGIERPVSFDVMETGRVIEIVHSLAKWKRHALKRYGFEPGEGLYTDMNAIRRDEETDNIHSIYVDQWDWEKVIRKEERTMDTLQRTVRSIFEVLKETEEFITSQYGYIQSFLPESITFLSSQELEERYPHLTPKEREHEAAREFKAVFITQIGGPLRSGKPHDGRAPDYDDWNLNGDILVYYPILDIGLELSSMGIRVDRAALLHQLEEKHCMERAQLPFQKAVIAEELPYSIGGGIGQSRLCMFFLNKAHIGEVQASIWPDSMYAECEQSGIYLL